MSHRFFASPNESGRAYLGPEEAAHALRVLRLTEGAEIEILSPEGKSYIAELDLSEDTPCAVIKSELASKEAPVEVTLFMGIPKGEKLELICQKLTELGIKTLTPVRMERCVAKIEPGEADKKLMRPRRISAEAQKQSGRNVPLEISSPIDMKALAAEISGYDACFLLWEEASGYRLSDAKNESPCLKRIAYVVGPEGGITAWEADMLKAAGARLVTLGPRILRAETAAIAAGAAIMTLWGDL